MPEKVRPTKKQKQLLDFVAKFIAEHGYGPSYREIMQGCSYSSVATVAAHVNNLIARGQLTKKDKSARSLELAGAGPIPKKMASNIIKPSEEKWLINHIDYRFKQAEQSSRISKTELDGLYVLVGALKVLGLEGASHSFIARLGEIKKRAA